MKPYSRLTVRKGASSFVDKALPEGLRYTVATVLFRKLQGMQK